MRLIKVHRHFCEFINITSCFPALKMAQMTFIMYTLPPSPLPFSLLLSLPCSSLLSLPCLFPLSSNPSPPLLMPFLSTTPPLLLHLPSQSPILTPPLLPHPIPLCSPCIGE